MSNRNRGRRGTGEDEPALTETGASASADLIQDMVRLLIWVSGFSSPLLSSSFSQLAHTRPSTALSPALCSACSLARISTESQSSPSELEQARSSQAHSLVTAEIDASSPSLWQLLVAAKFQD